MKTIKFFLVVILSNLIALCANAKPYAVISGVGHNGDCWVWFIDVYDDNGTTDPADDEYLASGSVSDCRSLGSDVIEMEYQDIHGFDNSYSSFEIESFNTEEDNLPKVNFDESLSIYPNPADGLVSVDLSSIDPKTGYISDDSGKIIQQLNLSRNDNTYVINTENLSPGSYVIAVYDGVKVHTSKLIVK